MSHLTDDDKRRAAELHALQAQIPLERPWPLYVALAIFAGTVLACLVL